MLHFEILPGRVLGKALFENITIQPQFAHFFLAFMHGRYNFMNLVNDLKTFDEGLYKNLMFLKTYTVMIMGTPLRSFVFNLWRSLFLKSCCVRYDGYLPMVI